MNLSFHLFQLQKIDSQIDEITKHNKNIQIEFENDDELRDANDRLADISSNLNNNEASLKIIIEQVNSLDAKIQRNNSTMYGGKVTNPKELQNLEAEMSMLNQQKKELEDAQLQGLILQETIEKELSEAKKEITFLQTKVLSKKSLLTSELEKNNNSLSKLTTERQAILDQLSGEVIDQYEKLRIAKQGVAVALLEDNCCSVCGSTFSPSESQSTRSSNDLFFCPTCQRIIYGG